ncbi:MAG TPA: hypothetical protein VGL37_01765 [Solirubrobacteraceae bacterium]|jgi:hypothetical protein
MSFAGILFVCWLAIGAVAFFVFSGLARLAARGDVEADLGIVGDAELRVLVGGRNEPRPSLEARLSQFGAPGTQLAWASSERAGHGTAGYTGSTSYAGSTTFTGAGFTT